MTVFFDKIVTRRIVNLSVDNTYQTSTLKRTMTQRLQSNEIIRFYRSLSLTFLLKNRSVKTRKRSSRNRPLLWFRMGYGPGATVPRGVRSRGYSSRGTSQGQQTPLNRFTGTRENITFPQLRLLVVITEIMRFIKWWIQDFPDRGCQPLGFWQKPIIWRDLC